ncbi:helix-turn-helix transcriptional regulator [Kitasatospora sp. YST-16]|uniref:helix-turn-helix domain-containing protein n=1 Tax=Kitasatospora sp. YST-16 TaxID=2998080 RepID=UPI002284ACA0|nr:helix-turn-helix transcriptional regulator [Kitasatospora sp. YST-16]WAL75771.1 helix-turn-helix transcriptional regulator [Kitasatospora sp. YST-16]WNW41839.1 helix-turn-helix transcriptional regulator [Streptomyces sp. Li-HN-5-13]
MTVDAVERAQVGPLLAQWRRRRGISQLELANLAGVSARHVGFVETGRSQPSREMLLRLAEHLDVPLRDRNTLLLAAGYAPVFQEKALDDPAMRPVLDAVRRVLHGHRPYPALVLDGRRTIVASNEPFDRLFTAGVAPHLLAPPANVLRLVLHPDGMAPRIVNLGQWRAKLLTGLARRAALDERLRPLHEELLGYPCDQPVPELHVPGPDEIMIPLELRYGDRELSFIGTIATFGTARDLTMAELIIESFFPADDRTAAYLAGS